ncbi:hypothetical protein F0344_13720 [Streptomyces finlayi]|uniref:Uncharacterized protein n=1 Tax=Streptomyces finlayi TaxID=67296 RepID=A0A7G7BJM6_9ACTN|nr:hypothetical protein [Streptomyces finlayi]QNE75541.1 hypothetical protein F0344_13720 [Streptomyces finlayi]
MPTPEREEPQSPQAWPSSTVSMKDLLASCAAASAVSTPPRDEHGAGDERNGRGEETERERRPGPPAQRRDAA